MKYPILAALILVAAAPLSSAALSEPLTFSDPRIIEDPSISPIAIRVGDLDGDGDLDVAYFAGDGGSLQMRYNLGDGQFGDSIMIADARGGHEFDLADVDGDGDLDILAGFSFDPRRLVWFQNNGDGTFGAEQLISDEIGQMATVMFADLNGDDRPDALVSSPARSAIVWFENLGGSFGPEVRLDSNQSQVSGVDVGDLDGDGDLDIVLATSRSDSVYWFRNQGNAVFDEGILITDQTLEVYNVTTGDLDGDGLLDVISASSEDDKLAWYRNLGDGTFGEQRIISRAFDTLLSASVADLDGDGDLDVLAASAGSEASSVKMSWYENDSRGNFGIQNILREGQGSSQEITSIDFDEDGDLDLFYADRGGNSVGWLENLRAPVPFLDFFRADETTIQTGGQVTLTWQVSGADAVTIEPGTVEPGSTSLVVSPTETTRYQLKATNAAGFITAEITVRVEGLPIIRSFRADPFTVELGDPYALTWDIEDATSIELSQGIGAVTGNRFPVQSQVEVASLIALGTEWSYLDDGSSLDAHPWTGLAFDDTSWSSGPAKLGYGDGDEATVIGFGPSSSNKFITSYFRKEFEIGDAAGLSSLALRLQRDDGAVIYLNGSQVASSNMPAFVDSSTLALNAASGGDETTLFEFPLDAGALRDGTNVIAVELHQATSNSSDLGFDLELTAQRAPSTITYTITATNQFGTSTAQATVNFQPSLFSEQFTRVDDFEGDTANIVVEDFDGDGFGDVLIGAEHNNIDDTVVWYRNNGDQTFSSRRKIAGFEAQGIRWVDAADLDGDGLPDVVSSSRDKLAWYRNRGNGNFSSQQILPIVGEPLFERSAVVGDFDGDGNIDVAHAVSRDDESQNIQWYSNNGTGTFAAPRVIYTGGKEIEALTVGDLNGDGIDDIAFIDSEDDKASWLQGNANGTFSTEQILPANVQLARRIEIADFDNDGDADVLVEGLQPAEFALFDNDGMGRFTSPRKIPFSGNPETLRANDIDLDGDLDLIYADSSGDRVIFRENDGTGFLSAEKILYEGSAGRIRALAIADLDGDFDSEILFGSRRSSMVDFLDNLLDPEPMVRSFSGTMDAGGERATLKWEVVAASEIRIDQGIGIVTGNSISVPLPETTTFQITAQSARGQVTAEFTVVLDTDLDGLPDDWEQLYYGNLVQGPNDDSDEDQLTNSEELAIGTSPIDKDSDDDGLDDREEFVTLGTDPLNADSDQDGFTDKEEAEANSNPLNARDFPATNLLDGLIFYTKLDTQISDEIGNISGVINGDNVVLSANGQVGGAVEFGSLGTADRNVTFAPTTGPGSSWSASFWFKPTDPQQTGTIVATNWQGDSFEARVSEGRLQLSSWRDGAEQELESTAPLDPQQWYHVGVCRSENGPLIAYLDGAAGRFSPVASTANAEETGETTVLLGGDFGRAQPFTGSIDDIAIWGRKIEAEEITKISSNGRAGTALNGINDRVAIPQVTVQPQGGAFLAGENTTLSVEFEGTGPFEIQWLRDGNEIPGATSSMLSLDPLRLQDSGKYSAVISNGAGDTRSVEIFITVANVTPLKTGDFEVQAVSPNRPGRDVVLSGDFMFVGSPNEGLGAVLVYLRDGSRLSGWRKVQTIPAPPLDPTSRQSFGHSLAAHGGTLVVGTEIFNVAYVYEQSGPETWELVQTISQPGLVGIGFSRALDLDARTLVIGATQADDLAPSAGAIFIYEKNATNGLWEETDMLTAGGEQDGLGASVAVDGDTIIASALGYDTPPGGTNSGGAFVFQRTNEAPGSSWRLVTQLRPVGLVAFADFGIAVDISGDTIVIGSPGSDFGVERAGAVFVFERNAGGANRWGQTTRLLHRGRRFLDLFGTDVQLHGDRLYASYVNDLLSNERNGSVFIYDRSGTGNAVWTEFAEITELPANGGRGFGTAIYVQGTELVVSAKKETSASEVLSKVYTYDLPPAENSPPTIEGGDPGFAIPGVLFNYEISTTEPDGQPVTIGAAVLPGWLRVIDRGDGTALLTGFPSTEDFGTHVVRILASDGLVNGSSVLEFNVEVVNTPPIVVGYDPVEVDEDSPDVSLDLFPGFTDAEYPDSELRFEIIGEVPATMLERVAINSADGTLNLGFVANANGQAEIMIRATDPGELSSTTTITIMVNPVNDQPEAGVAGPISADESASPKTVPTAILFSDIDVDDILTYSIVGNTAPSIFESVTIDSESGELQIVFAEYLDGVSNLTIRATDTGGLFADSELSVTLPPIPKPQVTPGRTIELNRLTGLFEQQITITNNSGRAMGAFELTISKLNEGVSVYNGSGTNGTGASLISHLSPIQPGESVTTKLEYYSKLRTAPGNPEFDAEPKLPTPTVAPPGRTFEIDRIVVLPEGVLIEFPTEIGRAYKVQYTDTTTWITSPMILRAGGNRVQWIDSGSPKTTSPPSTVTRRLYRVIELSDTAGR